MTRKTLPIIFTICFLSFNSPKGKDISKTHNGNDTIVREIPQWKRLYDESYPERDGEVNNHLGLTTIQYGFDGYQMRIWIPKDDFGKTFYLIIFKKQFGNWTGEFLNLIIDYYPDERRKIKNISKQVEIKSPKSGWNLFIDSLLATGIDTLHDPSIISGYKHSTDETGVSVEIATAKKYRFYNYPNFELNKEFFEDPAKLDKALELIERNFDIKMN